MHPPFFVVDHKVDPAPPSPVVRRAPKPQNSPARPELVVAPLPAPGLRDRFGRLLIRIGQRMILRQNARGV